MKLWKVLGVAAGFLLIFSTFAAADKVHVKAGGGTLDPAEGLNATQIALDSYAARVDRDGYLYITDEEYGGNTLAGRGVIRINPWGEVIRVVIDPVLLNNYLDDLCVDGEGNVFLAGNADGKIYKVTPPGSVIALPGTFTNAETINMDLDGNLYIGAGGNIYKMDRAGNSTLLYSQASNIEAIYVDGAGNIYFSGPSDFYIKRITPQGSVIDFAGDGINGHAGDGELATAAQIGLVRGITGDIWGNIYFTEQFNTLTGDCYTNVEYLRKVDAAGIISTIPIMTQPSACWGMPDNFSHSRVSIDNDGLVYVNDYRGANASSKVIQLRFTPNIASLSATQGSVGDRLVLSGRYFGSNGNGGTVTFNGISAPIVYWSNETIICTVPAGAATGDVVVTTPQPDNQASNGINFKIR